MFALSRYLTEQLDTQADRGRRPASAATAGPAGSTTTTDRLPRRPGPTAPRAAATGWRSLLNADGSVATDNSGIESTRWLNDAGVDDALDAEQVQAVSQVATGPTAVRVPVGGDVGAYRVTSRAAPDGRRLITGVSTAQVDELLAKLLGVVVGGTVIGLRARRRRGGRSGRPAQPAAARPGGATARRVSDLPLDRGEVALAERVPAADTDPRTEVGQVGAALNRCSTTSEPPSLARQASETRVRQFVADASHELRTPLASIRGYAELTRREADPVPPTVAHALGRVESEALRMPELVDDLLLLARLDSGRPLDESRST